MHSVPDTPNVAIPGNHYLLDMYQQNQPQKLQSKKRRTIVSEKKNSP